MEIPAGSESSLGGGSQDLSCLTVTIGGSYSLDGGSLQNAGAFLIESGGLLDAQGSIQLGSDFRNQGTLNAAASAMVFDGSCAAAGASINVSGVTTVANLTISSTSGQSFVLPNGANIVVTGSLVLQGQPGQPLQITTAGGLPATFTLGPGAQVTQQNVNLVNVYVGPPPSTAAVPVPVSGLGWTASLTLLLSILSWGALRSTRIRSFLRTQP
ncbi:hypothetical protein GCM10027276_14200 [Comamonas piscis]